MTALAGIGLIALALASWRVGRSLLFPPVAFTLIWGVALVWLALAGGTFFALADETCLVFVVGAAAFAGGGLATTAVADRMRWPERSTVVPEWVLDVMLIVLVAGLPLSLARIGPLGSDVLSVLARMRREQLLLGAAGVRADLIGNLVPFAIIFTLIAYSQAPRSAWARARAGLLLTVALGYQVFTGGRAGALLLVLAVGAVVWLRRGRLPVLGATVLVTLFVVVFGLIAIALGKGMARPDAPLAANVGPVIDGFQQYALGALVAFNGVVLDPNLIPDTGGLLRTVHELLNRFGAGYEIPQLHAQYLPIGNGRSINVYTAYFYYWPLGPAAMIGLCALAGAAVTAAYFAARTGGPVARPLFGVLCASMIQTVFNEPFYTNINMLGKLVVTGLVVSAVARRTVTPWRAPRAEDASYVGV